MWKGRKPMKILMVNKFLYPRGGAETYMLRIGEELTRRGHQVEYFGMYDEKNTVGNAEGLTTANMDFHASGAEKLLYTHITAGIAGYSEPLCGNGARAVCAYKQAAVKRCAVGKEYFIAVGKMLYIAHNAPGVLVGVLRQPEKISVKAGAVNVQIAALIKPAQPGFKVQRFYREYLR